MTNSKNSLVKKSQQQNSLFKNRARSFAKLSIFSVASAMILLCYQNCSSGVSFSAANLPSTDGPQNVPTPGPTGTPPPSSISASQIFKFGPLTNKIDILVVDDNSGSMELEQEKLAASFNDFTSSLNGVDWQIAVTTTDVSGYSGDTNVANDGTLNYEGFPSAMGRLIGPADFYTSVSSMIFGPNFIMKPSVANVASVFASVVQRTNTNKIYLEGAGDERAIYAANLTVNGFNDPNVAKGFFRPDANLAIVILSDEDERSCGDDPSRTDCSDGSEVNFEALDKPQSLVDNVAKTFGGTKNLIVDAISIIPNDKNCLALENTNASGLGTGGKYGDVYASLVKMTGGNMYSICDVLTPGAFTTDLTSISKSFANNVNPQSLALNYMPAQAPEIHIAAAAGASVDKTLACSWASNTQQVSCNKYPANTTITVSYYHY